MGTSISPRRTPAALVAGMTGILALLVSLGIVLVAATPAQAEEGYRYWNYSLLEGDSFEFAQTGPAESTPEDGDLVGWRFGTSTVAVGIAPRADLAEVNFDTVCGGAEAAAGEKRVAVLVDYGVEADAAGAEVPEPVAECAVVPEDASGQQTLESVVDVRGEDGMICALNGYPAKGCGDPVAKADVQQGEATVAFALPDAAATDDETSPAAGADTDAGEGTDSGIGWPLIAVLVLVVVLAAVAVPLYRRNRES